MRNNTIIFRSKFLPISFRLHRSIPPVLVISIIITCIIFIISASVGEYPIPPLATLKIILGINTENPDYDFIINTLRLPRALTACFVGIALAVSGAIMQGLTRNPLADPGIIGINAGASLVAVSVIILLPNLPAGALPISAFVGALIASGLIYIFAWDKGTHPVRLILIGVGISSVAAACTSLMVTFGQINDVNRALVWLAGSVYGRTWEQVLAFLPWLIIFVPLALIKASELNTLNLGDDIAKSLGSRIEWQRGLLLVISSALSGAAVATAGTIGFVGLISPHIARQLVGGNHQGLIPVAGIIGAIIVATSDLLGRVVFAPIEIPCGIVTSVIGAPYFLFLLVKSRTK